MARKQPRITEKTIRGLSSEKSFDRGMRYFKQGAVFDLVQQENTLRGNCAGSGYEPYRVSATLGANDVESTTCTCPYDWGGICKHTVALLLHWVHQPDDFLEMASLDDVLAGKNRDELAAAVKDMVNYDPDLMRFLEMAVQPGRKTPINLEAFKRQIDYALRQADYDDYYYGAQSVARELTQVLDAANRLLENGDWANAGVLFNLILSEVVSQYDELYDEDGDVSVVLQSCAEGLDACFTQGTPDADTRRQWLTTLLGAELKDIVEMGGIDLAPPAGEVVVRQATRDEWIWIEARIRAAIKKADHQYSDWPMEALIGLLTERLQFEGHEAEADALILELGSPRQQAFTLVGQGKVDEAVAIARRNFGDLPGLVINFADALVAAGAVHAAQDYVAGLLTTRNRASYLKWLAKHTQSSGNLSLSLDWWRQSLDESPSFETVQAIREVGRQLNSWEKERLHVIQTLEQKQAWPALIELALDENEIAQALNLLPKLRGWHSSNYNLRVAKAAESDHPQAAVNIYLRQAESLISIRGRGNYQEAAKLLVRVKQLYNAQNQTAEWETIINDIRSDNPRLRALHDELKKAGL
ncbi:MAG: hypothetical protein D6768_17375 [Chloroflexi bacterium]|nr:MAG: hypothetical protein D6768_17375 [Chloroflexota bacterium]